MRISDWSSDVCSSDLAIAAAIPTRNSLAQPRDPLGNRIAVRIGSLRRLDQFVDNMLGSRPIGVAHGHVDNVFAPPARRHFQFAGNVEYVGRQTFYTGEIRHDDPERGIKRGLSMGAMQQNYLPAPSGKIADKCNPS